MKKIKLDLLDRQILLELDQNARIPTTVLAKKLKRSRETIVYRISNLVKRGVIFKFRTVINPAKLGYVIFKVYSQLENKKEQRERLMQNLKHADHVWWFAECDGVWDLVIAFFTKNVSSFYDLKNKMLTEYRRLVIQDVTGTFANVYSFPKKYLLDVEEPTTTILNGSPEYHEIDLVSKKILNILSNDARISIADLAKKVKSTENIVKNKIKHMEDAGIIVQYRAMINLSKLGLAFFKANIYFSVLEKRREMALIEYLRRHQRVTYYIQSIAPWGAEIEFVAESISDFRGVMDAIKDKFSDIIKNYEFVLINNEDWLPGGIFSKNKF